MNPSNLPERRNFPCSITSVVARPWAPSSRPPKTEIRRNCRADLRKGGYKIAHNFSQVANGLDHKAFWIAVTAMCRKSGISTAKCLRRHRFGNTIGVHEDCTLARFTDTVPSHYYAAPDPYQAGNSPRYLEDDEWETAFVYHEQRRPGSGDLKWKALVRDGFHCRGCAVVVTSKTSHADHIEPVNHFANLEMANSWITSGHCVYDATSSSTRGYNGYRTIWKAGCLETCTSGLGLGPGRRFPGLHHRPSYRSHPAFPPPAHGLGLDRAASSIGRPWRSFRRVWGSDEFGSTNMSLASFLLTGCLFLLGLGCGRDRASESHKQPAPTSPKVEPTFGDELLGNGQL